MYKCLFSDSLTVCDTLAYAPGSCGFGNTDRNHVEHAWCAVYRGVCTTCKESARHAGIRFADAWRGRGTDRVKLALRFKGRLWRQTQINICT